MDANRLKRRLVGTGLGHVISVGRERLKLLRAAWRVSEISGTISQDMTARELLCRLCRPGGVFVDVGAHIGSVIADVKRACPAARIVAIEAVPAKAAYLARRYPDVQVHGVALGESEGETSFFVDRRRPGYSSMGRGGLATEDTEQIVVPVRRLDDLLAPSLPVDVLKIDVEGAELGVLRGAAGLVARCRPTVVFESAAGSGEGLGYPVEELFQWFADRDYEIHVPNRVAHEGPPLQRDGFVEAHFHPPRSFDYFGIPAERRKTIRDLARKILEVDVAGASG